MATTRDQLLDRIRRQFKGTAGDTTIIEAINEAIRGAEHWMVPKTDTSSVTIASETYAYALPSDLLVLLQVWARDAADDPWREVPAHMWRVEGLYGTQFLYLDSLEGLTTSTAIRLEYLTRLSELSTPSATLNIGELMEPLIVNYVVQYALHVLYEQEAAKGQAVDAFKAYSQLAQAGYQKAQQTIRGALTRRPAGRMHGPYPDRSLG